MGMITGPKLAEMSGKLSTGLFGRPGATAGGAGGAGGQICPTCHGTGKVGGSATSPVGTPPGMLGTGAMGGGG